MGKPFAAEIESLQATYAHALTSPVERLSSAVRSLGSLPLLAVGSGGSFTAAHLACELHRTFTQKHAQALTPLQLVSSPTGIREFAVLLPTAGGKNPDILGAFSHLIDQEPRNITIWCATVASRLAKAASKYRFVDIHEFELPSQKDGFLAVNSLLGFAVQLARVYSDVFGKGILLPPDIGAALAADDWNRPDTIDRICRDIWSRQTLVVLHGPTTASAALDLESKFTEAALGNVQIADFRHFAHGRHHWFAKRSSESALLAITCDDDRYIADSTLSLLPADLPVVRLDVQGSGWRACLDALLRVFLLVGSAGRARGIDPGDPGVPAFGRKIYHLDVYTDLEPHEGVSANERLAIERKAGTSIAVLAQAGTLALWRKAFATARNHLADASLGGLVFDYDGTLCDEDERYGPLPSEIADELIRILESGAAIGIATGRGQSVRKALRAAIPEEFWQRVIVGYYNGGDLGSIDNESCPDGTQETIDELKSLAQRLCSDPLLSATSKSIDLRRRQITVAPVVGVSPNQLWAYVQSLLHSTPDVGAVALRSGHSVDIIALGVSKLAVVERVRQVAGSNASVLCIGDRGCWPGNDFALLSTPLSLSVDETSSDPSCGWNLAPPGHRGRQATLGYLRQLRSVRGTLRLRLTPVEGTIL